MKRLKVVIIVLNYNQEEETAHCLERLEKLSYPTFEVLVVDNGSRRSPEGPLKSRFATVQWMALHENVGFAAGCNEGIRWALSRGAEAVLLLNNDAVIEPDLLEKMIETTALVDRVGVVGAVVYRPEDPLRPFLAGMKFDFLSARVHRIPPAPQGESVPCVSGSCFLIQKETLEKVGLLDERFFIYFEETDFCYRVWQKGFRVFYDARVKIRHQDGSTFGRESPALRYLYTRNRLLFLSKHCPSWCRPWSFLVRIIQDLLLASFFLLKGKGKMSQAVFYGLLDYWKGRFGKGRLDYFFHG